MGRKKVFPTKETVNPLQRMLGVYLRVERTRLLYSSNYIATKLGLNDTYLRLVEAGRATLNQSLIFKIIEIFADSKAQTHDSRTISFNRLAIFMIAIHWVGAELASSSSTEAEKNAIEALGGRVSDFQLFSERIKPYFDLHEGSSEQKEFLENVAALEVGKFLQSDAYGHEDQPGIEENILPRRELLDLPTLSIQILLDLKRSLGGRSFMHTAEIASKWESERSSEFESVRGVYVKSSLIVGEENLDCFHYEYLAEDRFQGIKMIFLSSEVKAEILERNFLSILNKKRASLKKPLEPLVDDASKIRFLCPSRQEQKALQQQLNRLWRRDSGNSKGTKCVAYWSFKTHLGMPIGFVCVQDSKGLQIWNLNLKDSLRNAKLFDELWDGLNATHKG